MTPGHGEDLSIRIAKLIRRARKRVRICSPVITTGPVLGTLAQVIARPVGRPRRLRRRDADPRGGAPVAREPERLVEAAAAAARDGRAVHRQELDAVWRRHGARLHAREGERVRRHGVRRLVQPVAERRAERRERARDRGRRDRRRARRVRRRGAREVRPGRAAAARRRLPALPVHEVVERALLSRRREPIGAAGPGLPDQRRARSGRRPAAARAARRRSASGRDGR